METFENKNEMMETSIIKFLQGEASEDEVNEILFNLNENNEFKTLFEAYKKVWFISSGVREEEVDSGRLWQNIKDGVDKQNNTIYLHEHHPKWQVYLKQAAVWLIFLALGSGLTHFFAGEEQNRKKLICSVHTPMGSRTRVDLPDGTEVWLNAGSVLEYPSEFEKEVRSVSLVGEGFFKVKSNKRWPFVVHTADMNVKALGTTFNVKAYTKENIETTLIEGIVKLENAKAEQNKFSYTLQPKEKFTYVRQLSQVNINGVSLKKKTTAKKSDEQTKTDSLLFNKNVDTELATSWKDKRWILDGEPLEDLAVLLERRYDVKINLKSEELKHYKFSGTIENETFEQVLKYLSFIVPIKYSIEKNRVEIAIDNHLKDKYIDYLK